MANLNTREIEHFAKDSSHWWDEEGPFKPLHKLNPVRIGYLRDQILEHTGKKNLKGLSILDIGCGGGLVCEPLSRLGAKVTGIDADENAISIAQEHANAQELKIDYIHGTAEELNKTFDVVLALEVIEHIPDPEAFVTMVMKLVKPDGVIIFSTLNRTAKSYALGIVAAEKILRWVPEGTHEWKKFVKPSEISRVLRQNDFDTQNVTGLIYNPFKDEFSLSASDVAVNYFLTAKKAMD